MSTCGCTPACICDCCSALPAAPSPGAVANLPALDALRYRIGTHGAFLDAMIARLTTHTLADDSRPLAGLRSRDPADAVIALLDAWALIGDVLTFYQERIANEGYLRTAIERRSLLELGRLVGYQLRPPVAATAHLAFTLTRDPQRDVRVTIPAGTRAQSVPGPGEQPQPFETADPLDARQSLGTLKPRPLRPQEITLSIAASMTALRVEGAAGDVKPGDRVLFDFGDHEDQQVVRIVTGVTPDPPPTPQPPTGQEQPASLTPPSARTTVALQPAETDPDPSTASTPGAADKSTSLPLEQLLGELDRRPTLPPTSAALLRRDPDHLFGGFADLTPQLLSALRPRLGDALYASLRSAQFAEQPTLRRVVAMQRAAPFGAAAPKWVPPAKRSGDLEPPREWTLNGDDAPQHPLTPPIVIGLATTISSASPTGPHDANTVSLDREYPQVLAGDWAVLEHAPVSPGTPLISRIDHVKRTGISAYLSAATVTMLTLAKTWLNTHDNLMLTDIRGVTVHVPSRTLTPAPVPDESPVEGARIDLDGIHEGLASGRLIIVTGERNDLADGSGVTDGELAMIATVEQTIDTTLPGDSVRTIMTLAAPLAFKYHRATTTIHANVVKSTQGESVSEVLGGGDPSRSLQTFTLSRKPLTYLAAATAFGAASTLHVRADDLLWHEALGLARMGPTDRGYLIRSADDDSASVIFGTGERGARPPSGADNIRAAYRAGAGATGNLGAGRVSQLVTRPAGVAGVSNPLAATGGADHDTASDARMNIPTSVEALERLVSVRDFEDFARARAGIGKASAAWLSDHQRRFVHLTVAGVHDAPIAPSSDLFIALRTALAACGDPHVPFKLAVRVLGFIVLIADVAIDPDRDWTIVEHAARAALLDAFSADRRQLGQDVLLSDIIGALHTVRGVRWVNVAGLTVVSESTPPEALAALAITLRGQPPARIQVPFAQASKDTAPVITPAHLAIVSPAIPDTLILRQGSTP